MNEHGYAAVNSEQTIFMKWVGQDFIIHGLFVDDMQHTMCAVLKGIRNTEIFPGTLIFAITAFWNASVHKRPAIFSNPGLSSITAYVTSIL